MRVMTIYRHTVSGPGPAGDIWIVTAHSSGDGTISAAHTAWLNVLTAFIGGTLEAMWSTEQQATEATTTSLSATTGLNVGQTRSALTYKGTGSGLTLPQRSSVVVGVRTSLANRSGRGRMYFPAPDSSHITDEGVLASADQTSLANSMASALSAQSAASLFGVYHRETLNITPITQVTVGKVLGSQRRRTNKVAPSYASADVS